MFNGDDDSLTAYQSIDVELVLMSEIIREPQPLWRTLSRVHESVGFRVLLIGFIALLMTAPLGMVGGVVHEREYNYESVLHNIASSWGRAQTVGGPILAVPYTESIIKKERVTDHDGTSREINRTITQDRIAYQLPSKLVINAEVDTESRQRSLYRTLVYRSKLDVSASFDTSFLNKLPGVIESVHFDQAYVAFGLSDTRAIDSVDQFHWDNDAVELTSGTRSDFMQSGFHAPVTLTVPSNGAGQVHELEAKLIVKGSQSIQFIPLGSSTEVNVSSSWPHPSFIGDLLPDQRTINDEGFSASWDVPHLARNYPQSFLDSDHVNLNELVAGVNLFEPVSLYAQIFRAVKYGFLFVLLTYLSLFILEQSIKQRLHAVQYGLIGAALALFFLMLLSLSEHIGFAKAYGVGAAVTIVMIASYVYAALKSVGRALLVAGILSMLYLILLVLLRLEDFALLMGTALLVGVLMLLMYVTRRANTAGSQ